MANEYIVVEISGGKTIISPEDADLLKKYTFFIDRDGYATAFTYNGKVTSIRLHQLIAGKQPNLIVDHTNRVKLDNRRSNLKHVTYKESAANRGAQIKDSDTPYLQSELQVGGTKGNDKITVAVKGLRQAVGRT